MRRFADQGGAGRKATVITPWIDCACALKSKASLPAQSANLTACVSRSWWSGPLAGFVPHNPARTGWGRTEHDVTRTASSLSSIPTSG